ncbi:O-succinylbenzoic acid--CoA ligase [Cellulomonas sp. NTE-D12]|nr:O-succinylbenzoic acid--CoA ligase [Cellulomonas sp. NTE-D12]
MGALRAALEDDGPAVLPVAEGSDGGGSDDGGPDGTADTRSDGRLPEDGVPDDVVLVVRTSGSTGAPRGVLLSVTALRASADATAERLAGPGRWLLALPVDHIAGLQVLVRSVLAGTGPTVLPPGPFRADRFAAAVAAAVGTGPAGPWYTSLVPTQLVRLLDDAAGTAALRRFDAVLVGGAATAGSLLDRAREAGVRVVTTYGMTETCGGCVYDGRPLDGVDVRLDATGRVWLAGPVLAVGYRGRPHLDAETFTVDADGRRWLRTGDLGRLADGVLTVTGRADDVLVTGGVNVAPGPVEDLLTGLPGIREACVVGVPDAEWGQAVVAVLVVGPDGPPPLAELRRYVADRLGAAAAPRRVVVVPALPLRGPGKPDRRAAAALASTSAGAENRTDRR